MSNTRLRNKADSKARNKKRLRKQAINKVLTEQQDLAEIIDDLGGMLATAHGYTETLGAVLQVYQPVMTPEENTACSKPWAVLVKDLIGLATVHTKLKSDFAEYKPKMDGDDEFVSLSTDTLQGLNLYHQAEEISNLYAMGIAPLLLDCYSQLQYIVEKYGDDKMDEVNAYLKQNFSDSSVAVTNKAENK